MGTKNNMLVVDFIFLFAGIICMVPVFLCVDKIKKMFYTIKCEFIFM